MKSITDLNGIGLDTNDYSDNRTPSITFSTYTPSTQSLTVYQGAPHNLPVASNITEIINYPLVGASYIIDMRNTLLDCNVQWPTIPSQCIVTNPAHNVWKISGIDSVATWNTIKSPVVTVNEEIIVDFTYMVSIEYLSSKYITWNVNIHTLLYETLSDPLEFAFENGYEQLILNTSKIYDYGQTQTNWTATVTPSITSPFSAIRTAGTGGTVSINPTTKAITLTGTKTEVNSHLSSIYITFLSTNTANLTLTTYAVNATNTKSKTTTQNLICETVRYLGFAGTGMYYSEDVPFLLTGLPPITNNESIGPIGNTPKTLSIVSGLTQFGSTASAGSNIGAGASVFGGTGMIFSTMNTGHLFSPNTTTGELGSGNFTIELWFGTSWTPTQWMTGSTHGIISKRNFSGAAAGTWALSYDGVNKRVQFWDLQNAVVVASTSTNSVTNNAQDHIAVNRVGSTVTIYINGISRGTGTCSTNFTNSQPLRIGDWDSAGSNELKYALIDEIRISNTNRYTAAFTTPTAAFTVDANTTALMHFDGTQGSTSYYDESGGVTISTLNPKLGSASISMSGGYLTVNASDDWNWFNQNYTIEAFIKNMSNPPSVLGIEVPIQLGLMSPTDTSRYWTFGIDTNNNASFSFTTAGNATTVVKGTTVLSLSTWHHIAMSFEKKTNTLKLFVNGIAEASLNVNTNPTFGLIPLVFGRHMEAFKSTMYIDEVRISSTNRYINNFTVPTQAFTPDSYTQLLLHGDGYNGSVITDSSMSVSGSTYTYTITPSDTASLRSATSSGTGGTFSYSTGTITMVGNKSQINNRLSTITVVPGSDYTNTYTLASTVVTPEVKTKTKSIPMYLSAQHNESSNTALTRYFTYNTTGVLFENNPIQIIDLDTTNPNFTITISTTNGTIGETSGTAVATYTKTGTKSAINTILSTLVFVPTNNATSGTVTFTQVKAGVTQTSASFSLVPHTYTISPTTSQAYINSTKEEGTAFAVVSSINITGVYGAVTNSYFEIDTTQVPSGCTLTWSSIHPSLTVTNTNGVYRVTGIDSVAKWNTCKNPTVTMNNTYFGSFSIGCKIVFDGLEYTYGQNMTFTDQYPLSLPTSLNVTYSSSSTTINMNTFTAYLYDRGSSSIQWTVSLTPSIPEAISSYVMSPFYNPYITYNATTKVLTITGSVSVVNSVLGDITIMMNPSSYYDVIMTYNASNGVNSETGSRYFYITNLDTSILSLTRASETFSTNVSTTISNGPQITATEYGMYTMDIYQYGNNTLTEFKAPVVSSAYVYNTNTMSTNPPHDNGTSDSSNVWYVPAMAAKQFAYSGDGNTMVKILAHDTITFQTPNTYIYTHDYNEIQVYKRTGTVWNYHSTILSPLTSTSIKGNFGEDGLELNYDGSKLMIAGRDESVASTTSGKIWIYVFSSNTYTLTSTIASIPRICLNYPTQHINAYPNPIAIDSTFTYITYYYNSYGNTTQIVSIYYNGSSWITSTFSTGLAYSQMSHYHDINNAQTKFAVMISDVVYLYTRASKTAVWSLDVSYTQVPTTGYIPQRIKIAESGNEFSVKNVKSNLVMLDTYKRDVSSNNLFTKRYSFSVPSTSQYPTVNSSFLRSDLFVSVKEPLIDFFTPGVPTISTPATLKLYKNTGSAWSLLSSTTITDAQNTPVEIGLIGDDTLLIPIMKYVSGAYTRVVPQAFVLTPSIVSGSFVTISNGKLTLIGTKPEINLAVDNITMTSSSTVDIDLIYKAVTPNGVTAARNQHVTKV